MGAFLLIPQSESLSRHHTRGSLRNGCQMRTSYLVLHIVGHGFGGDMRDERTTRFDVLIDAMAFGIGISICIFAYARADFVMEEGKEWGIGGCTIRHGSEQHGHGRALNTRSATSLRNNGR